MNPSSTVAAIVKGIFDILRKDKPSKGELEEIRKKLQRLVELSQNTGDAARRFVELEHVATRAAVHATELRAFMKKGEAFEVPIRASINKLLTDRVRRELGKDGLVRIHNYTADFEKSSDLVAKAMKHIEQSKSHLPHGELTDTRKELVSISTAIVLAGR